jgi:hypothetical protein
MPPVAEVSTVSAHERCTSRQKAHDGQSHNPHKQHSIKTSSEDLMSVQLCSLENFKKISGKFAHPPRLGEDVITQTLSDKYLHN